MKLPRVSDHAVLRYLERVGGFNIEAIRQQIAARCAPAAGLGAVAIKADGGKFIIDHSGSTVITFVPDTVNQTQRKRLAEGEAHAEA